MKKIHIYLLLVLFAFSCKNLREPVLGDSSNFTPPVITSGPVEGAQYLLVEDSAATTFATYVWSSASFNLNTERKYAIQVKAVNADGVQTIATITKSDTTASPKVEELNGAMAALGLAPEVEHEVETWILATMSEADPDNQAYSTTSDKIKFKATPYYQPVITDKKLGVPGDHQGWDPDNGKTVVVEVDPTNNASTFIGYLNLNQNFKFATGPAWSGTNYGFKSSAADQLSGDLDIDPNAGNIPVPDAGDYYVSMSTSGLKYTLEKMNWMVVDKEGTEVATMGYVASKVRWEASVTLEASKEYFFKGSDNHSFGAGEGNLLVLNGTTGMKGEGTAKMIMTLINPAEPVYSILGKEPITLPEVTSPTAGSSFALSEANFYAPATEVTWTASVRGKETPINYRVQIGDNVLMQVGGDVLTATLKTVDLNRGALGASGTPGSAGDVNLKVVAVYGDGDTGASDEVTVSVTPFKVWGVVGSAVTGTWDVIQDAIMKNVSGDDYTIQLKLVAGEIKFRENYDWSNNFPSANIAVASDGWYEITINAASKTHTLTKMTLPDDDYWGIIGNATPNGWDPDTDMVYDTNAGTWTFTGYLAEGEYKFRANDSWDYQMGKSADSDDVLEGGGNQTSIQIGTAGNYTVTCTFNRGNNSGTHSRTPIVN
ncbi:SusF/SusE family outer membrane protein [Flammeovirga aprica]|uniref:SusF/SusE family outer membrane protein n=1 Tax=Flammeovirga aprica JL-4 TaxID=694437 RepID=A0A7X9P330_9BACT|nr:SusF/SusE family outer membrane protein [Flammeovirga aprica]NME67724.1 SusF/SusE family outer membrane protein [Flammeovirga aprica JL-4]